MDDTQRPVDRHTFLRLVATHVKLIGSDTPLTMDANLYNLGLDSTAALNLLLEIEQKYAVTFPDALLTDVIFETPGALYEALLLLLRA
jgi:acyl carrier protein